MARYDLELVRAAASGHWPECFASLTGLPVNLFDGKHHACPKPTCGGDDRFRLFDQSKGALICNQCFKRKNGDGFASVQWLLDCDFKTALEKVAEYFRIEPEKGKRVIDPASDLEFLPWNPTLAGLWCLKKKPIKAEAIKAIGGRLARYRKQFNVIAIPVSDQAAKAVGWIMYRSDGGLLPRFDAAGNVVEEVKVKLTRGSKKGIVGSLAGDVLWKVEGSTDLLSLISAGLPPGHSAFTTANGAQEKPLEWIIEGCKGKQVNVVHDADKPGFEGATWINEADGRNRPGWCPTLMESARVVKHVQLPYEIQPTHGSDLRDYFLGGGTFATLAERAEETEPFTIEPEQKSQLDFVEEEEDDPHRLARINLRQYQDSHGGRLVFWRDEWWKWKSGKYRRIENGELRAKVTAAIRAEFERSWKLKKNRDARVKRVTKGLTVNVIAAMESMAAIPSSIEMPSWIPTRKRRNLISMQNGILDLDAVLEGRDVSECLMEHSPDWFSPFMLDYDFDINASCPLWLDYLNYTLEGDQERIEMLQEWAGYLLTADNRQQRFLVLEGDGGDGKTVFFAGITAMLGKDNISNVSIENFGGRFDLGCTLGKAANITGDVGEIESLAEGILKQFTGGDMMFFDRKNKPPISARPTAKLMCSWNIRPRIKDRSRGLWRRMLIVPFNREIEASRKVKGMDDDQWWINQGEAAGILMWAIVGLDRLIQQGDFTIPDISREALEDYQRESNPAMRFLDGCVEKISGSRLEQELLKDQCDQSGIEADELYEKYRKWCADESIQPVAKQNFGKQVKRQFGDLKHRRGSRGNRYFVYRLLSYSDGDF